MFKTQPILGRCLLFVSLVWLLAACGTNSIIFPPATSDNALNTVQTLEQNLNQADSDYALELFWEDSVVVEVKPGPNTIDQTSGYLILGPYYIPRAYSAPAEQTYYRGLEQINTYLAKLVDHQFHSKDSFYQQDEEGVTWVCQASSQMQFKASIQDGKIKTLMVTVF